MAAGPGIVRCHYDTERTESVKNMEMRKRETSQSETLAPTFVGHSLQNSDPGVTVYVCWECWLTLEWRTSVRLTKKSPQHLTIKGLESSLYWLNCRYVTRACRHMFNIDLNLPIVSENSGFKIQDFLYMSFFDIRKKLSHINNIYWHNKLLFLWHMVR